MKTRLFPLMIALVVLLAACSPAAPQATTAPTQEATESTTTEVVTEVATEEATEAVTEAATVTGELVIYSARSEPLIQPVLDAFKAKYPEITISLKSGNNSELGNAMIEEKANPQADIFITTELLTVQSLSQEGVFQSYRSPAAANLPEGFMGPNDTWTGLTRRARVIMYNTDLVSEEEAPKSIFDLTDPKWKGQIAAAGSTNGSMQAQIAAMRQLVGEEETEAWLNGLLANEVTFFGGHTDVRKAVGAGEFKLGLVNHYYYHLQLAEGSPVGIIYPDQGEGEIGLITNATSVAVVAGAKNVPAAQAFIDFLLSPEGQQIFASQNFENPLVSGVAQLEGVAALEDYRLADVDVAAAAAELDAIFDLMEKVGLP